MMGKRVFDNGLQSRCRRSARRRAFTLSELVVAIGILLLMLSLAGQVFSLTVKSTGQATALTKVSQLLRALEDTLREDLRHVQPGQSMLLIQGNPVNAYWTKEGKEADIDVNPANGYPHVSHPTLQNTMGLPVSPRADILMFFTARRAHSFVYPDVSSGLQQVVYGHATPGEYVPAGGGNYTFKQNQPIGQPQVFPVDSDLDNYPSDDDVSPVPAVEWHLARRGVLLVSTPPPPGANPPWTNAKEPDPDLPSVRGRDLAYGLASRAILNGETDVIGNFNYDEWVLKPGVFLDDVAKAGDDPWDLPTIFNGLKAMLSDRVTGTDVPFMRSLLDPTPPARRAARLGHYLLPRCASFKVEWTLDPRSEFVAGRLDRTTEVYWFDPGAPDPLAELRAAIDAAQAAGNIELHAALNDLLNLPTARPDGETYSFADRFNGQVLQDDPNAWLELAADTRPNLMVFGAARRNLGPDGTPGNVDDKFVPEDIFPRALRITVDVYDDQLRLERPIRHVMILPVGS